MPPPNESPIPPPGPLYIGYWDIRGKIHGWRPRGSRDWLMLYTEAGECLIRFKEGQTTAEPGDIILFQPGTPQDYGQHNSAGRWKHIWVHWLPRAECLEWVTWPHLSPGIRRLKLPVSLRPSVLGELTFADSVLRGGLPASELLATNAVERVLLYCEPVNIAHGESLKHPRIQAAADFLARNLRDRHSLQALAKRFGFSRSRFAALFRRQVGQTPFEYLESRRLLRAREHLVYSNQTLQQIADNVGFSSPFYLSLRFKKLFGKNPKTFRLHGIAGSLAGKPAARPPCGMV